MTREGEIDDGSSSGDNNTLNTRGEESHVSREGASKEESGT